MILADWELRDTDPGRGRFDDDAHDWMPVAAPGDTYLALHAAGRLAHPYVEQNEQDAAWVEHREWWWRTGFDAVPPAGDERIELIFEGLDTFAAIWLNGQLLGETSNMFAGSVFDVSHLLRADGRNDLRVRFTPPALETAGRDAPFWDVPDDHPIKGSKRNLMRKAQFGWGWDWAPSLPTIGIWRPVRLERHRIATIRELRFETLAIGNPARAAVAADIDEFAGAAQASFELRNPEGTLVASGRCDERTEFEVPDPQLWWTAELGAPALYSLTILLHAGGEELVRREQAVGLRTIALDTSPDPAEPGCDFFRFVLNGVPIFARGANWVPASSFVGGVDATHIIALIDLAADAHMNMLRIWGGGIYESDAFYDACDRRGLLVWQDLMFACAPYPENDPAFTASVEAEVAWQARRLRSRPCLALWCGNNEGQVIQEIMNDRTGEDLPFLGDKLFREAIPEILQDVDPTTPYWPGSPSGGPAHNSMRAGDVHNWTVWHGLPPVFDDEVDGTFDRSPEGVAYRRYAEDRGRFVSEFGLMSAPALATLARAIAPEDLALGSAGLNHRIKDRPLDKVNALLAPNTGLPATIEQYVDFSQAVQAEGLKFGIEHYRRRKPHCSGTLLWQLNDCWPGVSWSIIDGHGVPKPSWYAVRRAFAPVMASFKETGDGTIELWVTNDSLANVDIAGSVGLVTMEGALLECFPLGDTIAANESRMVWQGKPTGAPGHVLVARSPSFPDNRHFFAPLKDLPLLSNLKIERSENAITVSAVHYAHGIGLYASNPEARFSDNFFDLAAGESRTVAVTNALAEAIMVRPIMSPALRAPSLSIGWISDAKP